MSKIPKRTAQVILGLAQLAPWNVLERECGIKLAGCAVFALPELCVRRILRNHRLARGVRLIRKIGIGNVSVIDERIEKLHVLAHWLNAGFQYVWKPPAKRKPMQPAVRHVLLENFRAADVEGGDHVRRIHLESIVWLVPHRPFVDAPLEVFAEEVDPAIPLFETFRRIGDAAGKSGAARAGIDWISVAEFQKRLGAVRKAPVHDMVEPGDVHLALFAFALRPSGEDANLVHAQRLQVVAVLVEVHEVAVNRRAVDREVRGADLAYALRLEAADLLKRYLQCRRVAVGTCLDERRHCAVGGGRELHLALRRDRSREGRRHDHRCLYHSISCCD